MYGFQTQCGRDNWVSLIVDAVTTNDLDGERDLHQRGWRDLNLTVDAPMPASGVFIDGFQGCAIDDAHPTGGCCPGGSPGSSCSTEQRTAWMMGLRMALWALKKALGAKGKTIICNKTGGTYACGTDSTKCFCDASNSERFGGGVGGAIQLYDYNKLNPKCVTRASSATVTPLPGYGELLRLLYRIWRYWRY